jgi:hypothetical protein
MEEEDAIRRRIDELYSEIWHEREKLETLDTRSRDVRTAAREQAEAYERTKKILASE